MNKYPIIVTGISGGGKTEFSHRVAKLLVYEYLNVGDLLLEDLRKLNISILGRREIGPTFFKNNSIQRYIKILKENTNIAVVIDGVRLLEGVTALRHDWPQMIHVHLTGNSRRNQNVQVGDIYNEEVLEMKKLADITFDWFETMSDMELSIISRLAPILQD